MSRNATIANTQAPPLDQVAASLQRLRAEAGHVSYAKLADLISDRRIANGVPAYSATVSRSTVYDCFQPGRKRLNSGFVAEIVLELTGDPELAENWRQRCIDAQMPDVAAHFEGSTHNFIKGADNREYVSNTDIVNSVSESDDVAASSTEPIITKKSIRGNLIMSVMVLGVIMNVLPYLGSQAFFGGYSPLFLDMIGTATVAIVLGPWFGAAVAIMSAIVGVAIGAATGIVGTSLAFAPVAIIGALAWGYGVHRFSYARSLPRYLMLNTLVGVVCSLIALVIVLIVFGGQAMQSNIQTMSDTAVSIGIPQIPAIMVTNLLVSITDKVLAGLIALVVGGRWLRQLANPILVSLTAPINDAATRLAFAISSSVIAWRPTRSRRRSFA